VPDAAEPIVYRCRGLELLIQECPARWAAEGLAALELLDNHERGLLPAAGGLLDQTETYHETMRAARAALRE